LIKDFKPRLYQETIFATASQKNTLVVLPTGMGKTNIFLMLAAHRLTQYPKSKVLLIGPTRPLIEQYYRVFEKHFDIDKEQMAVFTGLVKPDERERQWNTAKVIFSTPQGLENDIIGNRIKLDEVSLLGVDEAHRAVGDYSYVFLAKQYHEKAKYPRILALTASPGADLEKINEVLQNLFIEDIEIRTDESPDVKPYVQELNLHWVKVDFPQEFREVHKYLVDCYRSKIAEIKNLGLIETTNLESKRDILGLQAHLQGELASGNRDFSVMRAISLAAEALKVQHAVELIETQGVEQLYKYLSEIERQARTSTVKAVQNLARDINFRSALIRTTTLYEKRIEHPKFIELLRIVAQKRAPGYKIMIFTQYRDSGQKIVDGLNRIGSRAVLFVGQAKKNGSGLTQKRQIEILKEFEAGVYDVLVSSSVGEEGLDIPQVDCVIFYEPIPSAIRHIQRRGRTARLAKGEVLILMTVGTRDEAYRWTAHHKEKMMYRTLEQLRGKLQLRKTEQTLRKYTEKSADKVKIFADYREKSSGVIKELIELGAELRLETLSVGDYLCSARCAIEFKTAEDFVDSLLDGRLLQQVKGLKQAYERPLIIVEGSRDLYSIRNVHPNAIRGILATITVSFGMPVLFTKNSQDTAALLALIARREQEEIGKEFSLHAKKPTGTKEQQEYIVGALPGVGPSLAKPLLRKFGSVKDIVNASEDDLKSVDLIGDKKAKAIRDVLDARYD
jgi:ERCC4-related helicase